MRKSKNRRFFKWIALIFLFVVILISFTLIYVNWKIPHDTKDYIFSDIDSIPQNKTALVLGASRYLAGGYANPYFTYRMNAAKELYDAGKVECFVLSGDNGRQSYNEPEDMKDALVEMGIPDSIIYLDYAGFRTLDSVVRMKEIFGQDSFIIVSQQFHNERAVYIAQHYDLKTYGHNAKDMTLNRMSYRTVIREKFARVKVFIDILMNKQPRYLGESIEIK